VKRDFGGNRLRISKEQREEILRLYTGGERREAELYAVSLGLREEYAYRLARERGAIPFMSLGYAHRERSATLNLESIINLLQGVANE
jgi:hypothetical protein